MNPTLKLAAVVVSVMVATSTAHGWGKRGHAAVCESAALLASEIESGEFLRSASFDLGYYCNVPDLIWKKGDLYQVEWTNHFMDLEIFDRAFRSSKVEKPFELDRLTFNAKFPDVKEEAGRAYWRIREMMAKLQTTVQELKRTNLDQTTRHRLQIDWLVAAGAVGHYIGDLGQPLHVSENYDGQFTRQKGIHAFFEDELVDHLFRKTSMQLESDVAKLAKTKWKEQKRRLSQKTEQQLIEDLTNSSNRSLKELLETDQKLGRKNVDRAAETNKKMIMDRLAESAVVLAELWTRRLGWKFDSNKFYSFEGMPSYIAPPRSQP